MRPAVFFFFFLFMPAAYAFDCDVLDGLNKIFCEEISLLGLSEEEKDMLIMDVLYSGRDTPDHGFVDYWNTNLEVVEPPEGVLTTDKGYIKGAWVKILAVMPSVLEADELYCSDSGELLTKYDYDVEIPSGKMGSDCRTDYELVSKSSKLSVYLNDNLIGNTEITAFTTSKDASFRAVLDVEQKTKIDRYAWRDYCCRSSQDCTYECTYKKGKRTCYKRCRTVCEQYCKSCDYYTTEYKEDKLTLTDSLQAKHYYKRPEIIFGISDEYYGIVEGSLNATGFANLRLEFEDAYYQNNKYHYDLFYSYKPYYVLTIRANEQLTESSSNVHVSNNDPEFRFIAERPQNCNIKASDHFKTYTQSCDTSFNETNIQISTDKLTYSENEPINVNITPTDQRVKLEYGDETVYSYGTAEFKAQKYANRITAQAGSVQASKIIHVGDKTSWAFLANLGLFLLIIVFVLKFFEKKRCHSYE